MFEYLQRRRGIVATIGGEEVPQEVVTWMDNIYIPFSLQQYLLETQEVENSEQNLVDTIMQLHIAENKPVDNEQNLVDGMKKLKMMMDQ